MRRVCVTGGAGFIGSNFADRLLEKGVQVPVLDYTGRTGGGWVGDNPFVQLDTSKIQTLGWQPTLTIPEAILATVEWLLSDQCTYL